MRTSAHVSSESPKFRRESFLCALVRVSVRCVDDQVTPPPEAVLISDLRNRAPGMSRRQAADAAGISHTHWRNIENGYRMFQGRPYAENGTAQMVARMAFVVGAEPGDLAERGRADAAAELEVLLADVEAGPWTERQRKRLRRSINRDSNA